MAEKNCETCKYTDCSQAEFPCRTCDEDYDLWEAATPVPPVKDMEAEGRGRTFVIQSDIDNLDKIKSIISKLETTDEFHVDWENIGLVETLMRVINNIKNFDNYFKKIESKPGSWFNAECEECGWFGSSEYCLGGHAIADTGDFSEVCCPVCNCEVL